MKKLDAIINKYLLWSIVLTVGFPCGVVGIIMGATKGMPWLLGVGIALVVIGFYGAPMLWIKFGEYKSMKSTLGAIENDNIYTVSDICEQTSKNNATVVGEINKLIEKRCLVGFLFKNKDHLEANNNQKAGRRVKCPNCGALMETGTENGCPYCGYKN